MGTSGLLESAILECVLTLNAGQCAGILHAKGKLMRPQKQTVDYFPHEANASEGDTLTILQNYWGNDGYAFWFKLLEKLATTHNHVIDCSNPVKWQLLLAKTHIDEQKGMAIMDKLAELDAIDAPLWRSNKVIWSQNFVNNVADAYKNRRRTIPLKPITTNNNLITTKDNPITTGESTQRKGKERKRDNTLFDTFWKAFPKRVAKQEAVKAFTKLNPDDTLLGVILKSIDASKKSEAWLKDGGKFIPHPATWLNGRRWEDEINIPQSIPEVTNTVEDYERESARQAEEKKHGR